MTEPTVGVRRYVVDLVERVVWTFLQAFLGALFAGGVLDVTGLTNLKAWQAAAMAGVAAVIALIKGLAAHWINNPDSASTAPNV